MFSLKTQQLTRVVLVLVGLGLIAYDLWVGSKRTAHATISEVTLGFVLVHPMAWMVIAFGFGILTGHLFWFQRVDQQGNVL